MLFLSSNGGPVLKSIKTKGKRQIITYWSYVDSRYVLFDLTILNHRVISG